MYQPQKKSHVYWLVAGLTLAFLWAFLHALEPVLMPFVLASILAYILNPLVPKLMYFKMSRAVASIILVLLSLCLLTVIFLIIAPLLIKQLGNIVAKFPDLMLWLNNVLPKINAFLGTQITLDFESFLAWAKNNQAMLKNTALSFLPVLASKGNNLLLLGINVFILPFLIYYFLLDWPKMVDQLKKWIPRSYLKESERILGECDSVLGQFLRGQLTVMIVMGLFYGLGLSLTGLDNGFTIGLLAGILVFIPYLGAITAFILASLTGWIQFGHWLDLIWIWSVLGIGQILESFLVTPYFVGERIGLSPLAVIFSLMAFGQLLGFVGILLALPMAAVCVVILRELKRYYSATPFYQGK